MAEKRQTFGEGFGPESLFGQLGVEQGFDAAEIEPTLALFGQPGQRLFLFARSGQQGIDRIDALEIAALHQHLGLIRSRGRQIERFVETFAADQQHHVAEIGAEVFRDFGLDFDTAVAVRSQVGDRTLEFEVRQRSRRRHREPDAEAEHAHRMAGRKPQQAGRAETMDVDPGFFFLLAVPLMAESEQRRQ